MEKNNHDKFIYSIEELLHGHWLKLIFPNFGELSTRIKRFKDAFKLVDFHDFIDVVNYTHNR